jgi:glycosyltransferase involved in cell wall biosynthesis
MELPYPANSGGRIYTWERLKQLKKYDNKIFLFSIKDKDEFVNYAELRKVCFNINMYNRPNKYINGLTNLFKPYSVISRYDKNMHNDIRNLIKKNEIDLIIIDIPEMLLNCPVNNNIPKVLTQHNIEYKVFQNIAKNSKNIIKKVIFKFEYIKMKKFENKIYSSNFLDGYTFISQNDMAEFKTSYPNNNCICIPQGYEIKKGNNKLSETNIMNTQKQKVIVFTGKMDYEPNAQAVKWFCNDIFPIIKESIRNIKFYIVGKNPKKEVLNLATQDIIVTGEVKDTKEYIQMADLFVIPLLSGGGVKIKLFEALGNGKVVVTTDKGVEGTKFLNNIHLFIANNSIEFANKCIYVLDDNNTSIKNELIHNSVKLIEDEYLWKGIGNVYNNYLNTIVYNYKC